MKEPEVTIDLALKLGLLPEEFSRIKEILGRLPTYTELGMYSVMWSEHCSYKNSIAVLKTLPRSGDRLLAAAGEENAGLVDIGDGIAVAFKIESHNHPSAVEPYQGAATGVGGILRDIFTMGARPIAVLNSLRFGNPDNRQVKYTIRNVVKGISDYGNSFGVPTIAGDVYFDECYRDNPLVNAMAVGIVETDKITRAIAKGNQNTVMIVGSSTGRDGIHGATFASEEINSESEHKRPSVQVGDPFTEKLLLEATLEALNTGHVIGLQDMGAAGITCSTSEMSAKGKSGMLIDLDKVFVREKGMSAYEIMLSESQERMLIVVEAGHESEIKKIFAKWDINAEIIGQVTDNSRLIIYRAGDKVADLPTESLVLGGGAPVYFRESKEPEYLKQTRNFQFESVPEPRNLNECILELTRSPNIATKRWIYEQYDSMVQANTPIYTVDAGVVRIRETSKAISIKTDCNSRYAYLNPRRGGTIAVAEAARNVVCTGALPIAITNCLNFGNPYKPEVFWQFKEVVAGITAACNVLGTPVTGGNVSFYNDNPQGSIYPTPIIGMLGLIDSLEFITTGEFKDEGDTIILLGNTKGHIGGSEYLKICHKLVTGDAPDIDLELEKAIQKACLEMNYGGILKSAHDISEGGIAIALIESCLAGKNLKGAEINLKTNVRNDFTLFGEDQSRILITADPGNVYKVLRIAEKYSIPNDIIGEVTNNGHLQINSIVNLNLNLLDREYCSLEKVLTE
jgi:phosphoribosylformylglycinamidine synthase II